MHKNKFATCLTFIAMLLSISSFSQYSTSSPFSQFGIGELAGLGTITNKGVGNSGIGYADSHTISFLNPASHATIDSLSFMFDAAMSTKYIEISKNDASARSTTNNFEYLAFAFPVARWWGVAFGIMPYTYVGYENKTISKLTNGEEYYTYFSGNQGLNQFIFANSVKIANVLSLGVHASYIFGESQYSTTVIFPDSYGMYQSSKNSYINCSGFYFDFGALYNYKLNDKNSASLGVNYSYDQKLHYTITSEAVYGTTTIKEIDEGSGNADIPGKLGLGFSYSYNTRCVFLIDYAMQDWSKAKSYNNDSENLKKSSRIGGGFIFYPNQFTATNYLQRMTYRLGAYIEDTNIQVYEGTNTTPNGLKDVGVTCGLVLPFRNTKNTVNLSVMAGQKSTGNANIIAEKYVFMNIGISLNESWFFKRKIN